MLQIDQLVEEEHVEVNTLPRELGNVMLTAHNDISLRIRNTAETLFGTIIKFNIKRGSPRLGLAGACIHLSSIHHHYPLMVSEIANIINKPPKFISSELKTLQKKIKELHLNYDINITDEKYINRYLLDISCAFGFDVNSEAYRAKVNKAIDYMNRMDILISRHANTRIGSVIYMLLTNDGYVVNRSEFSTLCRISESTFIDFSNTLEQYKSQILSSIQSQILSSIHSSETTPLDNRTI